MVMQRLHIPFHAGRIAIFDKLEAQVAILMAALGGHGPTAAQMGVAGSHMLLIRCLASDEYLQSS